MTTKDLVDRCVSEGFVKSRNLAGRKKEWTLIKGEENRSKLKLYFKPLEQFDEFKQYYVKTPGKVRISS